MTRRGKEKPDERYHPLAGRRCAASLRGGVDISKDALDTYWLSKRKHKQFANNKTGLRALIRWVRQAKVSLVVFEGEADKELIQCIYSPTNGVYHRLLETSLAASDLPFARVNLLAGRRLCAIAVRPRQARRFAEGIGTLAKTDRVPSQRCKHRLSGNGCCNAG